MNDWYIHNGVDHWEGRYSQAVAQAIATAQGWTAVEGIENVPAAVKAARELGTQSKAVAKAARGERLRSQLVNKTNGELSAYVDGRVSDAGTAEVLKNIILLLKTQAEEL